MKKLRVLLLTHQDLVPKTSTSGLSKEEIAAAKTEYDVLRGLRRLGHEVIPLGLKDELHPLRQALAEARPHIAFNLLEEFQGEAIFDHNVVSYLELMRTPYTGCNPRGLILARDKSLAKKILHYHRLRSPGFFVFPMGRKVKRPKALSFPLIVKSLVEEASLGISQASVVHNDEKLVERVQFIHQSLGTDAIVEEYVEGRELYASVLGNDRLAVLPIWELDISGLPDDAERIATRKVKWDSAYQKRYSIELKRAEKLDSEVQRHIQRTSKRIYHVLGLSGYARIDFRLDKEGKLFFLEANPNPDINNEDEFASAAEAAGIEYDALLQRILNLGLSHRPSSAEPVGEAAQS
jgi:D-alanine-D-alanine ligase